MRACADVRSSEILETGAGSGNRIPDTVVNTTQNAGNCNLVSGVTVETMDGADSSQDIHFTIQHVFWLSLFFSKFLV